MQMPTVTQQTNQNQNWKLKLKNWSSTSELLLEVESQIVPEEAEVCDKGA